MSCTPCSRSLPAFGLALLTAAGLATAGLPASPFRTDDWPGVTAADPAPD